MTKVIAIGKCTGGKAYITKTILKGEKLNE